jgi:cell division protein ZipA
MLITLLILIGLVVLAMIATKVFNQDRSANQYRRRKHRSGEPSLSASAQDASLDDDSDSVLGLKPSEPARSLHVVSKVKAKPRAPSVIVLSLMCEKGREYSGYELLQAILASGLRFGDMKIFHRHEQRSGRGDVLFSMASMVEPGTFDLPSMGSYHTPGLSFFLCYDRVSDPRRALDTMIETVSLLRDELGGDILDAKKQVVNKYNVADLYDLIDAHQQEASRQEAEEVS